MQRIFTLLLALTSYLLLLTLAGCQQNQPDETFNVSIKIGSDTQQVSATPDQTVSDVLHQASITTADLDRINPPGYTRVTPDMVITIVRVTEELVVTQEPIPYQQRTTLNEGLASGEKRILQAGINGVAEITIRVVYEDGVEISRNEIRRVVQTSPQDEVTMVGSQGQLPAVTINGTFAFISSGNAWIMRGNSGERRPLTLDGGVDGRVFALSRDGKRLLLTRNVSASSASATPASGSSLSTPTPTAPSAGSTGPFNSLWVVMDTTNPDSKPFRLRLDNILYADFLPGTPNTIVYTTAEPRPNFPGWQANNDLWSAQVSNRGSLSNFRLLLAPSSGGLYGWYGTRFSISPDGATLAWAQADAIGILKPPGRDSATPIPGRQAPRYVASTLVSFVPRNAYDFVWVPDISWSADGELIATTLHGPPLGAEMPEDSPIYDVSIVPFSGGYSASIALQAGIWASPQFSPMTAPDGTELDVRLAYLHALDPLNSVNSRYELIVSDTDGSNKQIIFPQPGQPGLSPQIIAWSPDGNQIAYVYQGNLFIIDVQTGLIQQLTQDGLSGSPRWVP
jgi:hypothetical protein